MAFEVAMAGVPMLITYRINAISAWFLRKMIKTKFANLINILLGKEVIPELLQEQCNPLLLASAANTMLTIPEIGKRQLSNIQEAMQQLTPLNGKKPSEEAARVVLNLL